MTKRIFVALACFGVLFTSCKKSVNESTPEEAIPQSVISKINDLGFNTSQIHRFNNGYIVEGDIFFSEEDLNKTFDNPLKLIVPNAEQYRTTNRVTGLPRTITVKLTGLGTAFIQGADLAISRYNALGLRLRFSRITSGTANITISGFNQGPSGGFITLGSAGFPTSSGNPYNSITMNTNSLAFGTNPNVNYIGSVIQHEIGHCIGFRHTDYMNRAFSCGSGGNEGAAPYGAINIPGTPTGPDPNSFMLACSNGGNRTFNTNDITAMRYLFQ
jgi:Dual-action HEIGH metallo-peptidase